MKLSKMFSAVAVLLTLFVGIGIAQETQWANTQVVLRSETVGRGANFYVNSNSLGKDICIDFTVDPSSYNVAGDFTGRYTLYATSGSREVYVGRYSAQTDAAWHVYVTFKWTAGACN